MLLTAAEQLRYTLFCDNSKVYIKRNYRQIYKLDIDHQYILLNCDRKSFFF